MKIVSILLAAASVAPTLAQVPITGDAFVVNVLKDAITLDEDIRNQESTQTQQEIRNDVTGLNEATIAKVKEEYKDRGSKFYADGRMIPYDDSEAPSLKDFKGVDLIPKGFGDPFVQKNSIMGNGAIVLPPAISNEVRRRGITSNVTKADITAEEYDPETYLSFTPDTDCSNPCTCLGVVGGDALVTKCNAACADITSLKSILTCAELKSKGLMALQFAKSMILEVEEGRGPGLLIKDTHPLASGATSGAMGQMEMSDLMAMEYGTYRTKGTA